MDALLTIPEAASYLGLSRARVYQLMHERQIPYTRVAPRRVVIRLADLDRWLDQRKPTAPVSRPAPRSRRAGL